MRGPDGIPGLAPPERPSGAYSRQPGFEAPGICDESARTRVPGCRPGFHASGTRIGAPRGRREMISINEGRARAGIRRAEARFGGCQACPLS